MIVNDLFMVVPMSSFTGYLTYMEYALGTEKGGVGGQADADPLKNAIASYRGADHAGAYTDPWNARTITNSPFEGLGTMTEDRARYTGAAVVETLGSDAKASWTPVLKAWDMNALDSEGKPTELTVTAGQIVGGTAGHKVKYIYDNEYIPQEKLPTLVGHMKGITLEARARRIAVYYSQIAAFQA